MTQKQDCKEKWTISILCGDFNTPLSVTDRPSRQKITKNTVELNNTIDLLDLTDIYRIIHLKLGNYTFFLSSQGIFIERDHILGH